MMTDAPGRLRDAIELAQAKKYDEALEILKNLYRADPENAEVLFLCGACFYKKNDFDKARQAWEKVLAIDSNHTKAAQWLAKISAVHSKPAILGGTSDGSQATGSSVPVSVEKPRVGKPPKRQKRRPNLLWLPIGVIVLFLVAFLGVDMFSNPRSYPILRSLLVSESVKPERTHDADKETAMVSSKKSQEKSNRDSEGSGSTPGMLPLILTGAGGILNLLSFIWFLILAYQASFLWFVLCLCFWPAQLLFLVLHWSGTKRPLIGYVIGVLLMIAGSAMSESAFSGFDIPEAELRNWEDLGWNTDPQVAFSQATKEGKLILLYFSTDWCSYCRQMEKWTLGDPRVAEFLVSRFVFCKVDGDSQSELVEKYQVEGFPTSVIVKSDGSEVLNLAGAYPPQEFLTALQGLFPS